MEGSVVPVLNGLSMWGITSRLSNGLAKVEHYPKYMRSIYREMFSQEFTEKVTAMANKSKSPAQKKRDAQGEFTWKGFCNIPMTADAKRLFDAWVEADYDHLTMFAGMLMSGYKFTLTYLAKNDAFQVAVTCTDPQDPNCGYTMSSFAPSPEDAIAVTAFKHFVMCDREWPVESGAVTKSQWG